MKSIIKPGYQEHLDVSKQFYCTHCGCVFKATWVDYNSNIKDGYWSDCPTCGRIAYEKTQ